jgi:putative modified peptide
MAKNFSRDLADKLLDKLSHDDDFREQFQLDPHAALAQLGHATPDADRGIAGTDPVVCMGSMQLASKDAIRAARADLHDQLTKSPFSYDVTV